MPLPSSGQIDLNAIHVEAGGASGSECSLNDADIRALIGKASGAQMSFSEWYGAGLSIDFPNISVVKAAGVHTDEVTAAVSGTGTLRFAMSGNGSIRAKAGAGGTFTAYVASGASFTLAVTDGQIIYLQWNHDAQASGTATVTNNATGATLDAVSLSSTLAS